MVAAAAVVAVVDGLFSLSEIAQVLQSPILSMLQAELVGRVAQETAPAQVLTAEQEAKAEMVE
jgi:hypothetical protein